jgi:hypothetical protein
MGDVAIVSRAIVPGQASVQSRGKRPHGGGQPPASTYQPQQETLTAMLGPFIRNIGLDMAPLSSTSSKSAVDSPDASDSAMPEGGMGKGGWGRGMGGWEGMTGKEVG